MKYIAICFELPLNCYFETKTLNNLIEINYFWCSITIPMQIFLWEIMHWLHDTPYKSVVFDKQRSTRNINAYMVFQHNDLKEYRVVDFGDLQWQFSNATI